MLAQLPPPQKGSFPGPVPQERTGEPFRKPHFFALAWTKPPRIRSIPVKEARAPACEGRNDRAQNNRMYRKIVPAVLLLVLVACVAGTNPSYAARPETLDKPQLEQLIKDNKGKVILLNFFATWCPPCRMEIPGLVNAYKAHSKDLAIIGFSVDTGTLDKVEPFCKDMGITYPVYHAGRNIIMTFGFTSIPFNVFYDKKGKMVLSGAGLLDEGHINDILKQLR